MRPCRKRLWPPPQVVYQGDQKTRREMLRSQQFNVLITTYECAVLEKSALAKVPWQVSITRHLPLLALQQHPCRYLPVRKFYLPRST